MLIWTLQVPFMFAQDTLVTTYRVEAGSRLWLDGTATTGDYSCKTGQVEGMAILRVASVRNHDSLNSDTMHNEVRVSIWVKSFNCGNNAMNKDMYNAMKADSFPLIQFELVETTILPDSGTIDSVRVVNTVGKLSIAGVTTIVSMPIKIKRLSSERFQIAGSKALSMHDFGITPPSALWGLIKANDQLAVNFNLVARKEGLKSQ